MRSILVIGWKSPSKPEGLYCGLDGVAANQAAQKAANTGEYVKIGKLINPSVIPVPCQPHPKPQAETPEPVTPAAAPIPVPAVAPTPAVPTPAETQTAPKSDKK